MSQFGALSDLAGRHALVTGGCGHIGIVAAETIAELGGSVTITDLETTRGDEIARQLSNSTGSDVDYVPADLASDREIERLVNTVSARRPQIDILVHSAALVGTSNLSGWSTTFEDQSIESWNLAMQINLTSVFGLSKALVPHMRLSGSASMVLISSIYGFLAPDPTLYEGTSIASPAAYFASKGGLEQLGKWLASMLAPQIRVNTICPGGVERGQDPLFKKRYSAKTPLGRMATEDDLRGAIGYLSSDLSRYVTGHRLVVDGGLSIR